MISCRNLVDLAVSMDTCKILCPETLKNRGGKRSHTPTWMEILNPLTSAKLVMTKLQNLFVALVNMDIFQVTLKLSLFTVNF